MRLYSDSPARRSLQLIADGVAALVLAGGISIAAAVHAAIAALGDVGRSIADTGSTLGGTFTDAGRTLGDVPLVGSGIRAPFDAAADAAGSLADAGAAQASAATTAAWIAAAGIVLVSLALVAAVWLPWRRAFVRRARSVDRLLALPGGEQVLAVRAIAESDADRLGAALAGRTVTEALADPVLVRRLAAEQARRAGVRL